MPIVGEASFELEPLAGKADVHHCRICIDIGGRAEGRINHVPDPIGVLVGHPRRPHQMIGLHVIDRGRRGDSVDDRHRHVGEPDIFAQGLAAGVQLGDDVAIRVIGIERGRRGRRRRMGDNARREPAHGIIGIDPAFRRRSRLERLGETAFRIILEDHGRTGAAAGGRDRGQLVRIGRIGISGRHAIGGLRRPVAGRVIEPGEGAVIADGAGEPVRRGVSEALRLSVVGEGRRIAGKLVVGDLVQRFAGPGEAAVEDGCRRRRAGDDAGDPIVGVAGEAL